MLLEGLPWRHGLREGNAGWAQPIQVRRTELGFDASIPILSVEK